VDGRGQDTKLEVRELLNHAFLIVGLASALACARPSHAPGATSAREPLRVEVGSRPIDLAAGDLDGDGKLDLASANAGDRRISVRLHRGEGFIPADSLPVDLEPHLLRLADLDLDGHLDVIATAHDSGSVWVWLGDGRGGFAAATGSPFAAIAADKPHNHGLAVGDLDGDGDPDVVVADQTARQAAVLLADGEGGLSVARGSPVALGGQPYPPALGDLDGDGRLDLVVPLVADQAIAVLLGDGHGGFQAAPGSPHRTEMVRPYGIALADLDGDGALDVVATHDDTDRVSLLLGDGRGRLRAAPGSPSSLGRRIGTRIAVADVDGDGFQDLVGAGSGSLVVAHGDGRGGLARLRLEPLGEGWAAIAADFDGDGRPDLAAPDVEGGALLVWLSGR